MSLAKREKQKEKSGFSCGLSANKLDIPSRRQIRNNDDYRRYLAKTRNTTPCTGDIDHGG